MLLDEDVLDTWFSSGLFPFSVLGWPDQVWNHSHLFFLFSFTGLDQLKESYEEKDLWREGERMTDLL